MASVGNHWCWDICSAFIYIFQFMDSLLKWTTDIITLLKIGKLFRKVILPSKMFMHIGFVGRTGPLKETCKKKKQLQM